MGFALAAVGGISVEAFLLLSDTVDLVRSISEGSKLGTGMALVGVAGSILGVRAAFKESRAPISALDTLVSVGSRIRRSAAAGVDAARRAPGRLMAEISCGDRGYSKVIRRFLNMKQRCFLKGTKVLTDSGRKNIEDIKVGDKVLSRNEQTGEQGYKRVSRLFRGETDAVVHLKIARKAAGKAARKAVGKSRVGKPAKASARRPAREPALAKTRVRGRTQRRVTTAKRSQAKASSADDGDGSGYDGGHDADCDSSDEGEDPDDADSSAAGEGSPALLAPEAELETELRCTPEHPFFVRGQGWVGADKLRVGDELVGDQGETLVVVAKEIRQQPARHFNFEVEDWHTYFVAETQVDPGVWVHNICGRGVAFLSGDAPSSQGFMHHRSTVLAAFRGANHTATSRRVLEAIESGAITLKITKNIDLAGDTVGGVMRVNRTMSMDDVLATIVHEGRHALDIADGVIPASAKEATLAQRLLAEARAFGDGARFARRNSLRSSQAFQHAAAHPAAVIEGILDAPGYGFDKRQVDDDLFRQAMGAFGVAR